MLQIPQYVLEKLRCSICGSYLSTKPIMVRAENQQVCGKCYKLLPADEKEKCVRQIGLESVAEIISFPCRYNNQGCPFRFSLSEEKDHETTCPYRSLMSFPPESSRYSNIETIYNQSLGTSENELHCETDQIKATLTYNIKDQQDFKNVSYKLEIKGNCDQSLVIKNANTQESEEVEINMDGKVFLGSKPELVCSDIKVKPIVTQNIYESLRSYDVREHEARCANCGAIANRNHCLLGHQSCNKCQSNICMNCIQLLERDAKTVCKNYKRGCNETLNIDTAHRHEANCPYNDYKCILEPCSVISTLANIKNHIKDDHTSEVFQTNEVHKKFTNKDDTFVIFCYGNIFKCVYYYYKSFVEFFVTYVGSSDEAVKFYYEIIVNIKGYVISKRSKCCTWNNVMLEKGITFEKTELLGTNEKKLNIEVTFRIINKR